MATQWKHLTASGSLILALCATSAAQAAIPPVDEAPLATAPVSRNTLAGLRGGYRVGNAAQGLELSFAITRVSYVNGELVAQNGFSLPAGSGASASTAQVIQNGPGNTFGLSADQLGNGALTVIQNTLDNQVIGNITVIDATVTNRSLVRSMAISGAVGQALANSLR